MGHTDRATDDTKPNHVFGPTGNGIENAQALSRHAWSSPADSSHDAHPTFVRSKQGDRVEGAPQYDRNQGFEDIVRMLASAEGKAYIPRARSFSPEMATKFPDGSFLRTDSPSERQDVSIKVNPQVAEAAKPGEAAPAKPGEVATAKPGEVATAKPGEVATAKPGEVATAKPGEATVPKPAEAAPQKPDVFNENGDRRPEAPTTPKPAEAAAPAKPDVFNANGDRHPDAPATAGPTDAANPTDAATKVLSSADSTPAQKFDAIRALSAQGINEVDVNGEKYRLEVSPLGSKGDAFVHMYKEGADGSQQIALRAIYRGHPGGADGTQTADGAGFYDQEKGKHGAVNFVGDRFAAANAGNGIAHFAGDGGVAAPPAPNADGTPGAERYAPHPPGTRAARRPAAPQYEQPPAPAGDPRPRQPYSPPPAPDAGRQPAPEAARQPAPEGARQPAPEAARQPAPEAARQPAPGDDSAQPAPGDTAAKQPVDADPDTTPGIDQLTSELSKSIVHVYSQVVEKGKLMNSSGTGFGVMTKDAQGNDATRIITDHHVVGDKRFVTLSVGGQEVKAEVIAIDSKNDLALLKPEGPGAEKVKPIELETSSAGLNSQSAIAALGYAGSHLNLDRRAGMVISNNGQIVSANTILEPGMSGGPAVDSNGKIVGVNDFVWTKTRHGQKMLTGPSGFISIDKVQNLMAQGRRFDT